MLSLVLWIGTPVSAQDRQIVPQPPAGQAGQDESDRTGRTPAGGQPEGDDPAAPASPQFGEEVVVVGSRAQPRSVTDSTVPIDVVPVTEVVRQGDSNLANQLRVLLPSFHVNPQEDGDLAALVRPASLRGMAPDHTLVLVNGKRRHRGAVVAWQGNGVADGAQGPDISTIPAIALRQIEVLRDGAAAQYGSDAIAGVLNFLLKDDRAGGSVELRGGTQGAGDGRQHAVAANAGLPLGRTGFANLSLEYGNTASTDRSVQRADAAGLIAAGNRRVAEPAQRWGSPEVDDDLKLFANAGHLFANGMQAYGHAGYARRDVLTFFYYRNPNTRGGVFSNDGGRTLLVGDVLAARGAGTAQCPAVAIGNDVPDPAALEAVADNPHCFSFQEQFPGGFTPRFGGVARDVSAVGGVRGRLAGDVLWDASVTAGANTADFSIRNTVNASLGPETPTTFDVGLYGQREVGVNLDLSRALTDRVHLAGGVEWRNEQFRIGLGQPESWAQGPYAAQGFSVGSNGTPGFGPIAAGRWNRANAAVYGDIEFRGAGRDWIVGTAARYERFSDFGGTLNGKLSGRVPLSGRVALRGSLGTGFRAPTPGQQNAFNVSTQYVLALDDLVNNGTIPSTSAVAGLRGGRPLTPERSVNLSVGAVTGGGPFTVTADYFRIDLSDRLTLSRLFALDAAEVGDLLAEGITSAGDLANFRFFTNDLETRTQGLDLVAAWTPPALDGATAISVLFNYTDTVATDFNPALLNPDRIADRIRLLEEALPDTRWNATLDQAVGRGRLLARLSYYGGWFDRRDARRYGGKPTVDLEVAWPVADAVTLTVGSRNILNTYPDENPNAGRLGNLYPPSTPFGFNGGFYYTRLNYRVGDRRLNASRPVGPPRRSRNALQHRGPGRRFSAHGSRSEAPHRARPRAVVARKTRSRRADRRDHQPDEPVSGRLSHSPCRCGNHGWSTGAERQPRALFGIHSAEGSQ